MQLWIYASSKATLSNSASARANILWGRLSRIDRAATTSSKSSPDVDISKSRVDGRESPNISTIVRTCLRRDSLSGRMISYSNPRARDGIETDVAADRQHVYMSSASTSDCSSINFLFLLFLFLFLGSTPSTRDVCCSSKCFCWCCCCCLFVGW